jgi:hypothetical protein
MMSRNWDSIANVVEVVSDASSEAAHRLHAMRMTQPLLKFALTSDVQRIALDVLMAGFLVGT